MLATVTVGIIHYLDFFHRPVFEIKDEEKEEDEEGWWGGE